MNPIVWRCRIMETHIGAHGSFASTVRCVTTVEITAKTKAEVAEVLARVIRERGLVAVSGVECSVVIPYEVVYP